jgi:3-isopropylmalate dehydrogenase
LKKLNLAIIPGDGIGPEVIEPAIAALTKALRGVEIQATSYGFGATRFLASGEVLTDNDMENLGKHDAILLGAIGHPRVPPGVLERGLLLKLRFGFDHFVNLRPSRLFPGVESPLSSAAEIDFVVVREGTEGLYVGNGGSLRTGTDHELANEVSVNTAHGVRRVVEYAFELASQRTGKRLTLVHKTNVLVHAGRLWSRIVSEVAERYPAVSYDYLHVDAATIHLVTSPERFDVIVTDNLFGDIITDLAAAVTGGLGLAASGNLNPTGKFPSMFEPVHGSAPDIAGKGLANPTAAILCSAMLAAHLGYQDAAQRIQQAVASDLLNGQGKTTSEIAKSILERI